MVFTGIWKIYHPLMRADFCLFDSYENDLKEKTFTSDVTAFHGTNDRMISKSMVEKWETMTTGAFALEIVQGGNHLFPLEKGKQNRLVETHRHSHRSKSHAKHRRLKKVKTIIYYELP